MDFNEFYEVLLSSSLTLLVLSVSFLIGYVLLKPYIALEPYERDLIAILTTFTVTFCFYYLIEALKFKRVSQLEWIYLSRFGIRLGIMSLLCLAHLFFSVSFYFLKLHNLLLTILSLNIIIETLVIGLTFKETYDLLFKNTNLKEFELQKNRHLYIDDK